MSQPDEAAPEQAPCRPPREAWPLARVLGLVLMKMGHAGPPLSHAAGRRQASLGTPVPRTPTLPMGCTPSSVTTLVTLGTAVGRALCVVGKTKECSTLAEA